MHSSAPACSQLYSSLVKKYTCYNNKQRNASFFKEHHSFIQFFQTHTSTEEVIFSTTATVSYIARNPIWLRFNWTSVELCQTLSVIIFSLYFFTCSFFYLLKESVAVHVQESSFHSEETQVIGPWELHWCYLYFCCSIWCLDYIKSKCRYLFLTCPLFEDFHSALHFLLPPSVSSTMVQREYIMVAQSSL